MIDCMKRIVHGVFISGIKKNSRYYIIYYMVHSKGRSGLCLGLVQANGRLAHVEEDEVF